MTIVDLNSTASRTYLYRQFAELEVGLSEFVRRSTSDPWDWLETLPYDKQSRIVGHWELSKRRNVETHPLAACMLSELLKIVSSLEALRVRLGFPSKRALGKRVPVQRIEDFRNRVMHPVRPIAVDPSDVDTLERVLQGIALLRERCRPRFTLIDGRAAERTAAYAPIAPPASQASSQ